MGKARDLARISPDGSGKIPLASGVSGALPDANAPSGSVLQVVHFNYSTKQTFSQPSSSGDVFTTGLTASITPVSANSSILVLVSANIAHGSSGTVVRSRIRRTGNGTAYSTASPQTDMLGSWTNVLYIPSNSMMWPNMAFQWLDSPNTTSPLTYDLQVSGNTGGLLVGINGQTGYDTWGNVSHMTLLEIAG